LPRPRFALWGAANVLVGALVLSGVIERAHVDRHALRWHVFLWDTLLLVWGVALLIALVGAVRERRRSLAAQS
jgi:hypothetical protein